MKTWLERNVEYAGDLDVAAHEVIAELDETDGILVGTEEFKQLVKDKAREHKVGPKDLVRRVRDFID